MYNLPTQDPPLHSGLPVRTEVKAGDRPLCIQALQKWGQTGRRDCETCLDFGANYNLEGNYCWMVL